VDREAPARCSHPRRKEWLECLAEPSGGGMFLILLMNLVAAHAILVQNVPHNHKLYSIWSTSSALHPLDFEQLRDVNIWR